MRRKTALSAAIETVNCAITIKGNRAFMRGEYPLEFVREVTSYFVEGYNFAPAYNKRIFDKLLGKWRRAWDGRSHLFEINTRSMPSGLARLVERELRAACPTARVMVTDERGYGPPIAGGDDGMFQLHGIDFGAGKFDYQLEAAKAAIKRGQCILKVATNGGKCLAPETPVMLLDGTVRRADEIHVGDQLMGPDSKPRSVLSTTTGEDMMYRIVPKRGGDSFICNSVHVLTVLDARTNEVRDIGLDEFLTWTVDAQRFSRLVRAAVDFPKLPAPPPVDPWLLGIWYADGRKDLSFVEITKPETETGIIDGLQQSASALDLALKSYKAPGGCAQWRLVSTQRGVSGNHLLTALRQIYGDGSALPARYLRGSREERAAFLAGIIDGDGYSDGTSIEITQRHERWAQDVAFLARSLGFNASVRAKQAKLPDWDAPRTYWRVVLMGDTAALPLRCVRKHARSTKRWDAVGFRVEKIGHGAYAGFTLDGDHRFLLGDFTVTHNTEIAAAVAKYLRVHTLFIVPGVDLLHQTRKRFAARLGEKLENVGIIGDGETKVGGWVTIATVDSLHARMNDDPEMKKWLQESVQMVFVDECHTAGSDTFYDVLDAIGAFYRIGLSGTPLDRSDGADLRLIAQTGDIAYEVSNKLLIERGVSVPVEIEIKRVDTPKVAGGNYKSVQKQAIVTNDTLNNDIIKWVPAQLDAGEQVLILVNTIEHGKALEKALQDVGAVVKFLHGSEPIQVRRDALAAFTAGELRCIIGTSIMRTGIDTPAIDIIVFADIGKSKIAALQAIGRGLRSRPGKTRLLVRDYANFCHKWLTNHSLKRLQIYKREQCFQLRVAA